MSSPEHIHEFKPTELKNRLGHGLVVQRMSGGALPLGYISWLIDSHRLLFRVLTTLDGVAEGISFLRFLKYPIIVEAIKAT